MYEFWYQVKYEYDDGGYRDDDGEFYGENAKECAEHIRKLYDGCKNLCIKSIVRVEEEVTLWQKKNI